MERKHGLYRWNRYMHSAVLGIMSYAASSIFLRMALSSIATYSQLARRQTAWTHKKKEDGCDKTAFRFCTAAAPSSARLDIRKIL